MSQFPDDATGDALNRIEQDGSDMSKPMEIDFFVVVTSEKAGIELATEAKKLGFHVEVESGDAAGEWTCYCTKTLVPAYSEVVKIEIMLDDLAKPLGGFADGFGSFGNV